MRAERSLHRAYRLGVVLFASCSLLASSPRAQLVDCDGDGALEPEELTVEFRTRGMTWGNGALPAGLDTADLNGDGSPDAIWSLMLASSSTLSWQANDGSGSFGPAQTIHAGASSGPGAHDVDGDGDMDVIARVTSLGLAWFENLDGTGSFGSARLIDADAGGYSLWDLDGDGDLDFVVWKDVSGGGFYQITNLGGGDFDSPVLLLSFGSVGWSLADLDGDHDPDLLYFRGSGDNRGVHWMRNLGGGLFDDAVTVTTDYSIARVRAEDLDGDGDLDLVCTRTATDSLRWYENTDGQGTFGPRRIIDSTTPGLVGLVAGDLDGDGDPELVASDDAGQSFWWENLGGANFAERRLAAEAPLVQGHGIVVGTADIDGDGVLDYSFWAEQIDDYTPSYSYWYGWQQNKLDDCNADGMPDKCEIDCDENGHADACDLITGKAIDCDGNRVPDVCDVGCSTCDTDGDGCLDAVDADPVDPAVCGDSDTDGCDDCSAGGYDPGDDGPDADGDGRCWFGDCNDDNGAAWAEPGEARSLMLTAIALETHLDWDATGEPGGMTVTYDLLRSGDGADFHSGTVCVEAAEFDTEALDASDPGPDGLLCYLVRVDNHCPGYGAMGSDSGGQARSGMTCP